MKLFESRQSAVISVFKRGIYVKIQLPIRCSGMPLGCSADTLFPAQQASIPGFPKAPEDQLLANATSGATSPESALRRALKYADRAAPG